MQQRPLRRVLTPPHGCIQMKSLIALARKKIPILVFHLKCHAIIGAAFLVANSLIQSNFELKNCLDRVTDSNYVVELRQHDSFICKRAQSDISQRQCSPFVVLT